MQLTFGAAEGLGKRKQTRREIFLGEMEQVVPWKSLLSLIESHYPTSGRRGRPPYALATMLRIHLLQQWYALSDPGMEDALHEIASMRLFAKLSGLDAIPDETTILNFRRLLETHGLAAKMLEAVNARARACAPARLSTRRSFRRQARPRTLTKRAIQRCIRPRRATSGTSA